MGIARNSFNNVALGISATSILIIATGLLAPFTPVAAVTAIMVGMASAAFLMSDKSNVPLEFNCKNFTHGVMIGLTTPIALGNLAVLAAKM